MHGVPGRRQNAQIDDSRSAALDEYERSEITVASHKDPPVLVGDAQQLGILRPRQTELSGGNNVIPRPLRKPIVMA